MAAFSWLVLCLCAAAAFCSEPMENSGMFEGDMILTEEQKQDFLYGSPNYQIPLAATKTSLWPTTIPYSMESSIASSSRAVSAINAAIADYQNLTCLRFVKRTNELGYLHFYQGSGCSSPVGYYRRANTISLASGCWYKGIVMHEIAHSLGFYHEQSRPDRDNYVTILWNNIATDKFHRNLVLRQALNLMVDVPAHKNQCLQQAATARTSTSVIVQDGERLDYAPKTDTNHGWKRAAERHVAFAEMQQPLLQPSRQQLLHVRKILDSANE
eukprot:gene10341-19038_t